MRLFDLSPKKYFYLKGRLFEKYDEILIKEDFKIRDFIVSHYTEGQKQFAKFRLFNDDCNLIDNYNIGDNLRVSFFIKGKTFLTKNNFEKKYSLILSAKIVERIDLDDKIFFETGYIDKVFHLNNKLNNVTEQEFALRISEADIGVKEDFNYYCLFKVQEEDLSILKPIILNKDELLENPNIDIKNTQRMVTVSFIIKSFKYKDKNNIIKYQNCLFAKEIEFVKRTSKDDR